MLSNFRGNSKEFEEILKVEEENKNYDSAIIDEMLSAKKTPHLKLEPEEELMMRIKKVYHKLFIFMNIIRKIQYKINHFNRCNQIIYFL